MHDLQGLGCDLEHFVVECDQQIDSNARRMNRQAKVGWRAPGLTIRNCAGSSNNLVPRGTKVSAIDVT